MSEMLVELRTERLVLSPFQIGDADEHYQLLVSEPAARHLPGGRVGSHQETVALTETFAEHWREHGYGVWAVREDGRFIGRCGLRLLPEFGGDVEVLYAFAPSSWRSGRAMEAARASVRYGFEQVGLDNLIGLVLPENVASRRVEQMCTPHMPERPVLVLGEDRFAPSSSWSRDARSRTSRPNRGYGGQHRHPRAPACSSPPA